MLLKRIAGILFGIAFLLAIVLFTGYGSSYISLPHAKLGFLIFGALGMFFNLLSFNKGKQEAGFNLLYWIGTMVIFVGLVFYMLHLAFYLYIIIAGISILGLSFVYTPKIHEKEKQDDILDQF